MAKFEHKTVLLTGASGGIGLEMARVLGREGARLVLVARRMDRLQQVANEIRSTPGAGGVEIIAADLTHPGACDEVHRKAAALGEIDVLINNAGVGEYGAFADQEAGAIEQLLQLNINALTRLTRLVLPSMIARRSGQIVNIASMAGFQPFPYMTVYAASKAYVIDFSFGLYEELRETGVGVTCICPGTTQTGFFDRGGFDHRRSEFLKMGASAADVAEECVSAIAKRKRFFVPGFGNRIASAVQRMFPARFLARMLGKYMKPGAKPTTGAPGPA
jgi:short-subunit dehydrogenase